MKHVYLHVPFCRRRCSYCDFSIAVRRAIPAAKYVEAIKRERDLLFTSGEWDEARLETLYFGGGTPSLLPPDAVADLVRLFLPSPSIARKGRAWQGIALYRPEGRGAGGQSSIPAKLALINAARFPPIIARKPSRESSLRRSGASPPIPPI